MQQKVVQIGNSIGVIIPQALSKNTLRPGDIVHVEKAPVGDAFVISKSGEGKTSFITPEFLSWLEAFNKKYKKALTELAKK